MRIHFLCMSVTAAVTLSVVPSQAGPCSSEIDRLQASLDAMLVATAVAGQPGRQSTAAMMHRQPTPSGIMAAEARLGEGARAKRATTAMEQARAADRAGDNSACERALADVRREIDR
ncbi:MAG TPA: hypothetical protein VKP67_02330 [Xanthobacteraceae bacterium]|nr:hypothetical protein [Xanthobacteraceae bacterium]